MDPCFFTGHRSFTVENGGDAPELLPAIISILAERGAPAGSVTPDL